jgi:hypothetical protein
LSFQLKELFTSAFEDKDNSEKISLLSSDTLDVERGEVLVSPRYRRSFQALTSIHESSVSDD